MRGVRLLRAVASLVKQVRSVTILCPLGFKHLLSFFGVTLAQLVKEREVRASGDTCAPQTADALLVAQVTSLALLALLGQDVAGIVRLGVAESVAHFG